MARIGFVGLGHMGLHMATNLIKKGHTVTGFDLQESSINALKAQGGIAASTLQDAAMSQEIIITMLQSGQQVKDVCSTSNGLFSIADKHSLFIDCSTIDVPTSREIHQLAVKHHLMSLDAPVSGGTAGAQSGTLTFMVGGDEDIFKRAEPILSNMGQKIIYTGKAGSGQAAKICNNMILGVSMIAVSEAFILAEQLGLSAQKLFNVVTHASGQCWVMNQYVPVAGVLDNVPANHNYQPGFTSAMMLKDLSLSQLLAKQVGIKTPAAECATALYQQFIDEGMGQLDFSAIIKAIQTTG